MKISYDNLIETIEEKVKNCQIATGEDGSPVITREDFERIKKEIHENANSALKKGFRIDDEVSPVSWSQYLCGSIGTYRHNYRVLVIK